MGGEYTLLAVDDDQDLLELLDLALGNQFRLLVADDGPSALQMLQVTRVDAILSDLVMPKMDGLAFLREARACGVDAPCLLLSAYPEQIDGAAASVPLFATLRKPCPVEKLSEACEAAVASAAYAAFAAEASPLQPAGTMTRPLPTEYFARLLRKHRSDLAFRRDRLVRARRDVLHRQVRAVERALERIELGLYGLCEFCGTRLDLPRLEAQPSARLCPACAHAARTAVAR